MTSRAYELRIATPPQPRHPRLTRKLEAQAARQRLAAKRARRSAVEDLIAFLPVRDFDDNEMVTVFVEGRVLNNFLLAIRRREV